jgi:adenylyl-sulfate kinase
MPRSQNVLSVVHGVSREEREERNRHRGGVLWLTGLPASGKSTLAMRLEAALHRMRIQAYVLDGDNIRQGLSSDLGFSPSERSENLRRVAEVAKVMADAGLVCIAAFISPLRADRAMARAINGSDFHEVHVKASLATCESRDPKGLYRKARSGLIAEFSGVTAPYEPPLDPELTLDTENASVDVCTDQALAYVVRHVAGARSAVVPG